MREPREGATFHYSLTHSLTHFTTSHLDKTGSEGRSEGCFWCFREVTEQITDLSILLIAYYLLLKPNASLVCSLVRWSHMNSTCHMMPPDAT